MYIEAIVENTLSVISYAQFRGLCTQDMALIHGAHSGRMFTSTEARPNSYNLVEAITLDKAIMSLCANDDA